MARPLPGCRAACQKAVGCRSCCRTGYGVRARLHRARTLMERATRALLGSAPSWQRRPNILPWFDRPDALDAVRRHGRGPEEATLLEKWIRDGYVIVEDCVDAADIDAMVATLDGLWDALRTIPNLTLLGLRETLDGEQRDLAHGALVALDAATRRRMRRASDWRIHGLHHLDDHARRIFFNRKLRRLA